MSDTDSGSTLCRDEVSSLELCEVAELIRTRQMSSREVTELTLRRIDRLDSVLGSYVCVMADSALHEAALADAAMAKGRYTGPLQGVPIGVKDIFDTAGVVTAGGTAFRADFVPEFDATVVSRLRNAGAVVMGKLATTEGAYTGYHPTLAAPLNPWDHSTWPGVSSSGSGVATASGLCFGSTGSDTGGSIRFPTAMCGVSGIKPTWGRVSRYGVMELAATLDHVGPIARSVRDAAAMLTVMAGADDDDPLSSLEPVGDYGADVALQRVPAVGVDLDCLARFDEGTRAMMTQVIQILEEMGWSVREITLPDLHSVVDDFGLVLAVETATAHSETFPSRADEYGPALRSLIELGRSVSAVDFHGLTKKRLAFGGLLQRLFCSVDIVLMPSIGLASPSLATVETLSENKGLYDALVTPTAPFNLSGSPAVCMPAGVTDRGTPLGMQFIGRHFAERFLVQAGHAFQQATSFHRRRPPMT